MRPGDGGEPAGRPSTEGADPYAAAMDRVTARRDAAEREQAGLPAYRSPRNVGLKLAIGLFLLFVVTRVGASRPPSAPELAADCARPAFRLSTTTVRGSAVVAYTLVGPAERRYILAVDTREVRPQAGGGYEAVPAGADRAFGTRPVQPAGCRATGRLGLAFDRAGTHVVRMFELGGATAQAVAEVEVTVAGR